MYSQLTLFPRADSTSTSPTSTLSNRPFFPDPSSLNPPPSPDDNAVNSRNGLARSVLEYSLLAVAIAVAACLILRRLSRLKRNHQPLSTFFSFTAPPGSNPPTSDTLSSLPTRFPRTTGLPLSQLQSEPVTQTNPSRFRFPFYPSSYLLPTIPSSAHRNIRTRAFDIDEGGRRLHLAEEGYALGDKDPLPAYDGGAGGPPKYGEVIPWFDGVDDGVSGGRAGVGAGNRQGGNIGEEREMRGRGNEATTVPLYYPPEDADLQVVWASASTGPGEVADEGQPRTVTSELSTGRRNVEHSSRCTSPEASRDTRLAR